MVKINLEIKKKDLWLVSAIFVFMLGIGLVIGFGSNSPTTMGHDFGEIEGLQTALDAKQDVLGSNNCNGQVMVGINSDGTVICEDDDIAAALSSCYWGGVQFSVQSFCCVANEKQICYTDGCHDLGYKSECNGDTYDCP